MGTEANVIVVKPQGVYYAAVATASPTATGTLGGSVSMSGWTDLGYVDGEGAIKMTFGKEVKRVRPAGMEGNLKGLVTSKMATIEVMGIEEIIANLEIALGDGVLASNEIPDGGAGELAYIALCVVTTRAVYHFKKVSQAEELAKDVDDNSEAKMPFKLETFVEAAATAGERQWVCMERTA